MKKLLVALLAFVSIVGIAKGATTLYEYYQEQGKNLPSVEERAGIASTMGIEGYSGSQSQNIALLGYLQGEGIPLGADLPQQYALFDDYLASGITKTATSLTLTNGETRDGVTLSGRICFTIDVNTPTAEYVCGTAAGTAISNLERGVLPSDPTSTSTDYAFPHRRFATISITDFPFNALVRRLLQGTDSLPATLSYASSTSLSTMGANTLVTKNYADGITAGGFSNLNVATTKGLYALGTAPETVGIDLASLSGLRFDDAYNLQVATSSASGIAIDTDGAVKVATTTDFTWTGKHSFSGQTNLTGGWYSSSTAQVSTTPTTGNDIVNKNYVDNKILSYVDLVNSSATMTTHGTAYNVRQYIGNGAFVVSPSDIITVGLDTETNSSSGDELVTFYLGNGTATTTLAAITQSSGYYNIYCDFVILIGSATNSWEYKSICVSDNKSLLYTWSGSSSVDLGSGFNILSTATNSSQDGRTGTSNYLYIKK